jgi:predicted phosphodiesterase
LSYAALGRVAVVADVHGNAQACREALRTVRRRGFDRLIILGDLLTYGCEPAAVLHLVGEAVGRDGAVMVAGNHDQLYLDLARGSRGYYDSLPSWLRETVDWTAGAVAGTDLARALPWVERHETETVLFAHANPFAYGDWTYLNGPTDLARAARALRGRGKRVGVFGHTHRAKIALVAADGGARVDAPGERGGRRLVPLGTAGKSVVVVDPGSVGQPRDQAKASTVLFLSPSTAGLELEHVHVPYDVDAHKRAIMAAALSPATRAKLLGYLP